MRAAAVRDVTSLAPSCFVSMRVGCCVAAWLMVLTVHVPCCGAVSSVFYDAQARSRRKSRPRREVLREGQVPRLGRVREGRNASWNRRVVLDVPGDFNMFRLCHLIIIRLAVVRI